MFHTSIWWSKLNHFCNFHRRIRAIQASQWYWNSNNVCIEITLHICNTNKSNSEFVFFFRIFDKNLAALTEQNRNLELNLHSLLHILIQNYISSFTFVHYFFNSDFVNAHTCRRQISFVSFWKWKKTIVMCLIHSKNITIHSCFHIRKCHHSFLFNRLANRCAFGFYFSFSSTTAFLY